MECSQDGSMLEKVAKALSALLVFFNKGGQHQFLLCKQKGKQNEKLLAAV